MWYFLENVAWVFHEIFLRSLIAGDNRVNVVADFSFISKRIARVWKEIWWKKGEEDSEAINKNIPLRTVSSNIFHYHLSGKIYGSLTYHARTFSPSQLWNHTSFCVWCELKSFAFAIAFFFSLPYFMRNLVVKYARGLNYWM